MDQFIQSPPWLMLTEAAHTLSLHDHLRVVTLLREYVAGIAALAGLPPTVVIWGSARTRPDTSEYRAAYETASLLATNGFGILTGGGPGIMEAANRGARDGGARSIGLTIHLAREERPNAYLDVAVPFTQFAPRHAAFLAAASAFVIFPGGLGTLHELFEALCAIQNRKLARVPLVLYGRKFWGGLLSFLCETLVDAGTIDASDLDLLSVAETPEEVVAAITESGHHDDRLQSEFEAEGMPSVMLSPTWVEALP